MISDNTRLIEILGGSESTLQPIQTEQKRGSNFDIPYFQHENHMWRKPCIRDKICCAV